MSAHLEPRRRLVPPLSDDQEDTKVTSEQHRRLAAAGIDPPLEHFAPTDNGERAGRASEAKGDKPDRRSMATQLVDLARERYRFASTPSGDPYAVRHGEHVVRMLRGGRNALRAELARTYNTNTGRAPSASALADALTVLEGQAGDLVEDVHLRVARVRDGLVLDLGEETGRAVYITADDWQIVTEVSVLFQRTELTGALPIPECGGRLDDLRDVLNVGDASWPLIVGVLVASLIPDIAHPIVGLFGEQGTAKTTMCRTLVSTIDPSAAPVRSIPRDLEGWAVGAAGSYVVGIDNVSRISEWFSDALCRAATGDGLVRRRLYSDSGISVLSFRRCIVLTSIDAGALRGDLADRLVPIDCERIAPGARRTDEDLACRWRARHPKVLGALLDLVSAALAELPDVVLDELPRMADFAKVLAAIDRVAGLGALDAYQQLGTRLADEVIESDDVAQAVRTFMAERSEWTGTAGELRAALTPEKPPKDWPTSDRALSGHLRRAAPALRKIGVHMTFDEPREAGTGRRLLTITTENGAGDGV